MIKPNHQALLQGGNEGSVRGWDYLPDLEPNPAVLKNLHLEAIDSCTRQLHTYVPRSKGGVRISSVEPDMLGYHPVTQTFVESVAEKIGGRVVSAQFNFYDPGAELLPHNDGPNIDPETTLVLSLVGDGSFEILPDLGLGYTDNKTIDVKPGDGVILLPITARDRKMFTSRRHALKNGRALTRVSLVAGFV